MIPRIPFPPLSVRAVFTVWGRGRGDCWHGNAPRLCSDLLIMRSHSKFTISIVIRQWPWQSETSNATERVSQQQHNTTRIADPANKYVPQTFGWGTAAASAKQKGRSQHCRECIFLFKGVQQPHQPSRRRSHGAHLFRDGCLVPVNERLTGSPPIMEGHHTPQS